MVERLLKAKSGINLDATDRHGRTALMIATSENGIEIVEILLKAGASASKVNNSGHDAFSLALRNRHFRLLENLKRWAKGRPEMADTLDRLADRERRQAMEETSKLTDQDSTVDESSEEQLGFVAAAATGDIAQVRSMLPENFDAEKRAEALNAAAAHGRDAVVDLLLDGELPDAALTAAAKAAAAFGQIRTAQKLVDRGASPPSLWSSPRVSDTAFFLSFVELDADARRRLGSEIAKLEKESLSMLQSCRMRRAILPFFPGCSIIAFEDTSAPGQNEQFAIETSKASLRLLNWTNEPIYQLASELLPDFSDAGTVLYARFFFHWVRGQLGRFQIVENPNEIRWTDAADEKMRDDVASRLLKLRVVKRAADHIRLRGTVIFKNALLGTDILVTTCEMDFMDSETGLSQHLNVAQLKLVNEKLLLENLEIEIDDPPGRFG